jgi:Nucleotidyltransferase domain
VGRQGRADRVRVAVRGGVAHSRNYVDALAGAIRDALGTQLRAVYLTGSAAVGAYVPAESDIDVLVAVEGADRAALERVVEMCGHEALPCPARKLELVVYELVALAQPDARPRWSLNFNTGACTYHVGFDPGQEPAHWFVLDLAFARRHAQAVVGPLPAELIGDPGDTAIAQALDDMVEWYERNEPEGAVVARRRAEHWRATGTFVAKPRPPSERAQAS